jgi:hypothetical protein
MQKFPVDQLRHDVEVLIIQPINPCPNSGVDSFCGHKNSLTMGPKMKILRQLKTLRIQHSRVPNIGRKTLWGLSGLEILDLRCGIHKLRRQKWYFVTKIVLTYCEKKLF